ncbi:glycosyl hydrolase family 71-domain-containing protein [Roridomyces roridus]|uniref:Glycosyl hydrolase family 71-domain-containing protein n=1 Tax=Roridomyces roridus TaxID=1738132 RepID=A0AAD7FCP4_9AGAR|nr:glycosyl hydrolase family 71-domain-containing protein [Roridomyces roridus]
MRFFAAVLSLAAAATAATARYSKRSDDQGLALHKRAPLPSNSSQVQDDPTELLKRDGTKYVFMHHIVGNTYSYTLDTWKDDIQQIAAKGVDAIALNIGGDAWQMTQVGNAYAAAQALGFPTKLFFSFDFTTNLGCSLSDIVSRTKQFSGHPAQFKVNGKPMISSYAGDCLGNGGWQSLKDQTNAYIMPFIWGLEGNFGSYPSMDSWYCWGCAWPQGNYDKNTDDDNYYISQLGSKYATTVSMWFYTHLSDKNRLLRSDDWLINSRWEQLVAMRDKLTFVEMVTWNDFGESDYFGPVRVDQPAGTTWADGYPHTAWYDMSEYYIKAFKTGVYPTITQDVIYYWARPHPHDAIVNDGNRPDNWDWTQDYLWVAAFCSSTCTVTLQSGSPGATTFSNLPAGVNKLKIPLSAGRVTVSMIKSGQTVISKTDQDFMYTTSPAKYNFNAFVGAAYASSTPTTTTTVTTPTTTSTTTTTATTPTTTSTTTTPASTATTTSVAGTSFTYLGCYPDNSSPRTLNNGIHTSTSGVASCLATCKNAGYPYAGVQYGSECWCSSTLTSGVKPVSEGDCNMSCSGGTGTCGGYYRVNVYYAADELTGTTTTSTTTSPTTTSTTTTSTTTASTTAAATSTPTWTSLGCYVDNGSPRTLNNGMHITSGSLTTASCLATCANAGYLYGGTEYGSECWCASSLTSGVSSAPSGDCNMGCSGKSSEMCGGYYRISVYKASSVVPPPALTWSSLGCYQDQSSQRTLGATSFSSGAQTVEGCQASCAASGYRYAGLEYGSECWCATSLTAGVSKANNGDCNMSCSGSGSEICGGSYRINVYSASTASKKRRLGSEELAN